MIAPQEFEKRKRNALDEIGSRIFIAESRVAELAALLSTAESDLDALLRQQEDITRETFEEAKGDAEYDAWKARRDEEHINK